MKNNHGHWFTLLLLIGLLLTSCVPAPTSSGTAATTGATVEQTFIVASANDVGN